MFDHSLSELINSEKNAPSLFSKFSQRMTREHWYSFAQLKVSSSTPISVNSLMQRVEGNIIPVSEYFLLVAHKECKAELTKSVRAAANGSSNPELKGWAFELEQLDTVEDLIINNPKTLLSKDRAIVLPIGSDKTATYDGVSIGHTNGDAFTIGCSRWNQGCFDVTFFVKSKLITLQFTVSKTIPSRLILFAT